MAKMNRFVPLRVCLLTGGSALLKQIAQRKVKLLTFLETLSVSRAKTKKSEIGNWVALWTKAKAGQRLPVWEFHHSLRLFYNLVSLE